MGRKGAGGRGGTCEVLTPKMEAFCQEYVVCDSAAQAMVKVGYSERTASAQASRLLKKVVVKARIAELRAAAAKPIVAQLTGRILSEHERKVILSEIAAASLSDYVLAGPDGDEVSITRDSPNPHALAEVQTRTDYDSDGSKPRVVQRIKLRDPVQAIAELNKMEKVYETGNQAPATPNQTFIFNLNGQSVSARELYQRAMIAANNAPEGQVIDCTDAPENQDRRE